MPCLSAEIIPLLASFAPAMTAPTYRNALVLLCGVILAPGRRTVCSALRVLGLEQSNFSQYHRVLSRARWSALLMSRLLLTLLVRAFVPEEEPLVILVDATLERRRGSKVAYKGWFRDAVRSTARKVVLTLGIRWCCCCLLVKVPWAKRPWALPFLAVPVLSEKACRKWGKRYRGTIGWTCHLIARIRRWQPQRALTLVGDGEFAAVSLVAACQQLTGSVRLVARLRKDAALFDFPPPSPPGKRGPKPKKGARLPSLAQRLANPQTAWQRVKLTWYGAKEKCLEVSSGVALWYTPGQAPVPIRWVLVRSPEGDPQPIEAGALCCSDAAVSAEAILAWFVSRWNIEVTFEEVRAHLGFETQRQWSRRAVGRSAPCLLGLFSLVVLFAKTLHPEQLPLSATGWYPKEEATFCDALAAVRRHLWGSWNSRNSDHDAELCLIPRSLWLRLQQVACYAA